MPFTASDICKLIFAFILPPLGVFLERGCGADLLINICLTILGWLPGIIHAMYVYSFAQIAAIRLGLLTILPTATLYSSTKPPNNCRWIFNLFRYVAFYRRNQAQQVISIWSACFRGAPGERARLEHPRRLACHL
ncbi:hypothetical protein P175DRAFT_0476252 [Aspergillus ochraceoroseus IBT 24754]|uniref:Plasma membrane proteolipid 3 n=1 Tax=Aspergillus ochraceoroseus IBT 24754 TaxID=1392256 RepID=A0A2T5LYF5_9EURO|nr:uncharacterized protein P175DRAFT_0476252 [Aspergillus ochraceoroseus IBT 24754]PTU21317.1 hypothetical protein P175DRAFT_0476252 [Aspergillus ochraceoroseus IBT 24754]